MRPAPEVRHMDRLQERLDSAEKGHMAAVRALHQLACGVLEPRVLVRRYRHKLGNDDMALEAFDRQIARARGNP